MGMRDDRDPAKQKAQLLKLLSEKGRKNYIQPEDRMDVDVAETTERKDNHTCYYCRKPGHLKKDCRKRLADEAKQGNSLPKARTIKIVDEAKEEVGGEIKSKLQTLSEEDRHSLLLNIVEQDF